MPTSPSPDSLDRKGRIGGLAPTDGRGGGGEKGRQSGAGQNGGDGGGGGDNGAGGKGGFSGGEVGGSGGIAGGAQEGRSVEEKGGSGGSEVARSPEDIACRSSATSFAEKPAGSRSCVDCWGSSWWMSRCAIVTSAVSERQVRQRLMAAWVSEIS